MIFRQLFDPESSSYTYLLAGGAGGEALLLDPVLARVEQYLRLLRELGLRLVAALDTHLHADHLSGVGALRERTACRTAAISAVGSPVLRIKKFPTDIVAGVCRQVK